MKLVWIGLFRQDGGAIVGIKGRFDGFWEFKLKPWDIAAGILLVEEAGGMVTDFEGGEVDLLKGEVLASNGRIHSLMQNVLKGAKVNT